MAQPGANHPARTRFPHRAGRVSTISALDGEMHHPGSMPKNVAWPRAAASRCVPIDEIENPTLQNAPTKKVPAFRQTAPSMGRPKHWSGSFQFAGRGPLEVPRGSLCHLQTVRGDSRAAFNLASPVVLGRTTLQLRVTTEYTPWLPCAASFQDSRDRCPLGDGDTISMGKAMAFRP